MDLQEKICWRLLKTDFLRQILANFSMEENSNYYTKEVNSWKSLLVGIVSDLLRDLERGLA